MGQRNAVVWLQLGDLGEVGQGGARVAFLHVLCGKELEKLHVLLTP